MFQGRPSIFQRENAKLHYITGTWLHSKRVWLLSRQEWDNSSSQFLHSGEQYRLCKWPYVTAAWCLPKGWLVCNCHSLCYSRVSLIKRALRAVVFDSLVYKVVFPIERGGEVATAGLAAHFEASTGDMLSTPTTVKPDEEKPAPSLHHIEPFSRVNNARN